MRKTDIEAIYPLSPMQQGMLFHTLYSPNSALYFEQFACVIQGHLNGPAFKRAWERLLRRHPALRTAFISNKAAKPLQVVCGRVHIPLEEQDWRELSPIEQQVRLKAYLKANRERAFELSQAPLMRLALMRVAGDTHYLIWGFHHLLLDRWSVSVIIDELLAFHEAFYQGRDLRLEPSPPYEVYIAWLQQQDLSRARAFWRQALKGFRAPTVLAVDREPGGLPDQATLYESQEVRLPVAATAALHAYARQSHLTMNTLVQGAWALLLSRYSREDDVIFGATFSGRQADLPRVERMVGLLINTLPVRVQLAPDDLLLPWLRRLQEQFVELSQYEHSPLVEIQGWSEVPRGRPLFESIVIFENVPVASSRESNESFRVREIPSGGGETNYALTLLALPGSELLLRIIYDCSRFDSSAITRMLRHFQTILEAIVAHSDGSLSTMPFLTEPERHQLLMKWNDTRADYPKDSCVHQIFEAQAQKTPDGSAIVFGGEQLSYRELNVRANQLAHHLQGLGVRPGVLVGLCIERSVEMVVALLGVLKAGGAYVPLDPAYPKDRLSFMLEDAQVAVLLTQQPLLQRFPASGTTAVCLDTEWEVIARNRSENPVSQATPDAPAYVIYTSGSTGRPKGVEIPHRAVVNFLNSMRQEPGLTAQDVLLAVTTLSFDIAVLELVLPLVVGARIVVVSREVAADGRRLAAQLSASGATIMQATPTTWRLLVEAGWKGNAQLKILCGGEALSGELAAQLLERGKEVWNLYGPTETTIWSALYRVGPGVVGTVPIGRPIANTQLYVLDRHQQPVPVGVLGELYIGGVGVARGYLKRPELTAERFIPDPFSAAPGGRLYRTGDLARYRSDGTIEFLGRVDHQVKIRGFRIELEEIEAVLRQHPGVREGVVVAREDVPGDKRLVAYVVLAQEPAPSPPDLRHFLRTKLPDYMVPAGFVFLDRFPLTPNGKVDRRALPVPAAAKLDPESGAEDAAPRTPMEMALADIWKEVLGLERVGLYDNFFDLGGHSLLAMRVIIRFEEQEGVQLSPRDLMLQHLGQLAAVCEERIRASSAPVAADARLGGRILRTLQGFVRARSANSD